MKMKWLHSFLKSLICTQIGLFLAGCESDLAGPVLKENLSKLVGQPVTAAFKLFGAPIRQQGAEGEKEYVWSATETIMGQTKGQLEGEKLQCTLKIYADPHDTIIHSDFDGAYGACARFASMLDPNYSLPDYHLYGAP